jgi:hypothetical protein
MPHFTVPDGDSLIEVNHCHGPGQGHPCRPGEGRSESELERERLRHQAEDVRSGMAQRREERLATTTVGDVERHEQMAKRPSLGDRLANRAAGMRRQRLAAGGVSAEKQRKKDFQMARGRQTQKMVRAIRSREEITTPDTPENAAHFSVGVVWSPTPSRPWSVKTASGRTLKGFKDAESAQRFIDAGKAYHATQRWKPGKQR